MKQNIHVLISANIAKRLAGDPLRSNRSIADELGVAEWCVRRMRTILELSGLLTITASRIGSNGVERPLT